MWARGRKSEAQKYDNKRNQVTSDHKTGWKLCILTADTSNNGIGRDNQWHICLRSSKVFSEFRDEQPIANTAMDKHKIAKESGKHDTPSVSAVRWIIWYFGRHAWNIRRQIIVRQSHTELGGVAVGAWPVRRFHSGQVLNITGFVNLGIWAFMLLLHIHDQKYSLHMSLLQLPSRTSAGSLNSFQT